MLYTVLVLCTNKNLPVWMVVMEFNLNSNLRVFGNNTKRCDYQDHSHKQLLVRIETKFFCACLLQKQHILFEISIKEGTSG